MSLTGKTALITGGSRGIGRGIAMALAQAGCNVAVNYLRNRSAGEETVAALQACGVEAVALRANVGDEDEVRKLVERAAETLGSVDIFVGNAASGVLRPALEINRRAWDWTLNINARSILFAAQAAVPHMRRRGWGRIITVTSLGSRRVFPEYSVVGVSKAAIEAVTRYLAIELAPAGITANCISPGVVVTDALDHFPRRDQMIAHAEQNTPARRLVTPQDVGELAVWLCSPEAAMLVGQTIEIDGGYGLLA